MVKMILNCYTCKEFVFAISLLQSFPYMSFLCLDATLVNMVTNTFHCRKSYQKIIRARRIFIFFIDIQTETFYIIWQKKIFTSKTATFSIILFLYWKNLRMWKINMEFWIKRKINTVTVRKLNIFNMQLQCAEKVKWFFCLF